MSSASSFVPHDLQNRASSSFDVAHDGQTPAANVRFLLLSAGSRPRLCSIRFSALSAASRFHQPPRQLALDQLA